MSALSSLVCFWSIRFLLLFQLFRNFNFFYTILSLWISTIWFPIISLFSSLLTPLLSLLSFSLPLTTFISSSFSSSFSSSPYFQNSLVSLSPHSYFILLFLFLLILILSCCFSFSSFLFSLFALIQKLPDSRQWWLIIISRQSLT